VSANADEPPLLRLRGWHSSSRRPIGLDFENVWVLPVLFVPVAASETEFGRVQLILPYVPAYPVCLDGAFVSININSRSSMNCTSTNGAIRRYESIHQPYFSMIFFLSTTVATRHRSNMFWIQY